MLPWKLVVWMALGAVLVKESDATSRLYDRAREKAMSRIRTLLLRLKTSGDEESAAGPAVADGNAH